MYSNDRLEINKENLESYFFRFINYNDESSFSYIYDYLSKKIKPVINSITSDSKVTDDIFHSSWLKILDKPDRFRQDKGSLYNYFYTISKNQALKFIQSIKKREREDFETFSGKSDVKIVESSLEKSIMRLPESFRDAVILYYYYDVELKEISRMLGLEQNTIKTRLFRAKDKLKQLI